MFKKLTTIIVISIVTVSAIFLISVSVLSYKIFFNFTSKEISEARLTSVNEGVKQISSFVTRVSDAGLYIVTNRGIIETFSEDSIDNYQAIVEQRDLTKLINEIASFQRGIDSIELYTDRYNDYPQVIDSKIFSLSEIEDEPWFERSRTMDSAWIPEHQSTISEVSVVSYFHRLVNQSGRTTGFIKINILPNTFFGYMSDVDLINDVEGSLLLLDSGGRVIDQTSNTDISEITGQILSFNNNGNFEILKYPYTKLSNHHELLEIDKNQYLFIVSKSTNENWRLVDLINIESLYGQMKKIGSTIIFIGIIFLLISIPISYWLVKKLMNPITRLIQAMKKVEKGDFETRVEPGFIEEYKVLGINFNQMTYQLGESLKELKRKNREKREAELAALQNQIVPHFLYNTLDMIHWRALDYDAEDISFMVNQLSKMFRIGLSGGKTFITLRAELEHAQCYIDLQSAHLHTDINYQVRVSPALKDAYLPKIIIQPFIENSIKHGYPYEFEGQINISIDVKEIDSHLEIIVTDNGVGFPDHWKMNDTNGIGIRNIQERIQMYFGEEYGLTLFNDDNFGAIVQIKLPLIKDQKKLHVLLGEEVEDI